jgi:cytochrome P450
MPVMSTTSDTELPVIPVPRDAHCPLKPPADFADWRQKPGLRRVMYHGKPTWMVSRYQDIRAALVDPRLSADTIAAAIMPSGSDDTAPVMFARVDDPEHHRLRRMVTASFTFRRCEAMRPKIQELVDHYLDEMIGTGPPADLVRHFGLPVPSMVIALLLGVPPEDLELFQHQTTIGIGHQVHRRAEGGGVRGNVCLHPGVGAPQRAPARRRLDQPPGHRIHRDGSARP